MAELIHYHILSVWSYSALGVGFLTEILYLLAIGRYRPRIPHSRPVHWSTIFWFSLAMFVYFIAFASPLDHLSDDFLFSAHMVQHMLETVVMIPLLYCGVPDWLAAWGLSWRPLKRIWPIMTMPAVAIIGFDVIFDVFHFPILYNLTLVNEPFHILEHILFFIFGVFLWWPVLGVVKTYPRLKPGGQLLYLFFAFDGTMPPAILLLMWNTPLYTPYAHDPRLWHLSLVSDQRLGAVIMLVFMVVSFAIAAIRAFSLFEFQGWYD